MTASSTGDSLRVKSPLLAGALLVFALPGCGGGVDVTYRRATGEVRSYVRTLEIEGTNPSGTEGRVREEVATRETAVEVQRGAQATLQVDIERIVVEVFRGDGKEPVLRMDSRIPEVPLPAGKEPETEAEKFALVTAPLRRVAGSRVEADQQFNGKILRFGGIEELRMRVLESVPEGDPRRARTEQTSWELWLAQRLACAVGVPSRSMKPGVDVHFLDMRTLPDTTGTGGYLYYAGNCRLAGVVDGVARLEMDAEVFLDPLKGMPPWPRGMAERRNFLRLRKGLCKAWAKVEVETGLLLEDEHVTDLDLVFLRPGGKGEMAIPQKVTQRSKLVR